MATPENSILRGCGPGGLGTEVPSGVQRQSPGKGSGERTSTKSLRSRSCVCTQCLHILTAEMIEIWKFPRNCRRDSSLSKWGLISDTLRGLTNPQDHAWSRHWSLTLSPPIPLRLYTLSYWSNPPFLIFDIRALRRSGLSARAPECQKFTSAIATLENVQHKRCLFHLSIAFF